MSSKMSHSCNAYGLTEVILFVCAVSLFNMGGKCNGMAVNWLLEISNNSKLGK